MTTFNSFAMGGILGVFIMFMISVGDLKEIRSLPMIYEQCTNYPGVASTCYTTARFSDEESCLKELAHHKEMDTLVFHCRK